MWLSLDALDKICAVDLDFVQSLGAVALLDLVLTLLSWLRLEEVQDCLGRPASVRST